MKALYLGVFAATVITTLSLADARPAFQVRCPSGYTLKKDVANPEWFQCDKAGATATATPTCPSGTTYEARDGLNKDRCVRTTTTNGAMHCELHVGDVRDNWRIDPRPQWDKCINPTKSNKGERSVKCDAGFSEHMGPAPGYVDTCTRSSQSYSDPSCPAGYDYKSQGGRDTCQKESGVDTVKPFF